MATPHSAVSTLIQKLLDDPNVGHNDMFRELMQAGLQDLVNAEASATLGAAPYERTSERKNRRNGTRSKKISTTSGDVDINIPKLRHGSFCPLAAVAPTPGRQSPARGHLPGLHRRSIHPQSR